MQTRVADNAIPRFRSHQQTIKLTTLDIRAFSRDLIEQPISLDSYDAAITAQKMKLQETADLITFTEEILKGNFIFCSVYRYRGVFRKK